MPTNKMGREELDRIYKRILGSPNGAPDLRREVRNEREQNELIAATIRVLHQHCDPMVLIGMLAMACCYLADEFGVSREQLSRIMLEARQNHAVEFKPEGNAAGGQIVAEAAKAVPE